MALCTELAEPTGEALQRLIGAENLDEALHDIAKAARADCAERYPVGPGLGDVERSTWSADSTTSWSKS